MILIIKRFCGIITSQGFVFSLLSIIVPLQGDTEPVGLNSPEKRKLENALYEDAVMQKKCRQIEDGYDLIDTENHESI